MSGTVPITIRVPPELADELKQLADAEERTLSQFCMRVLREFVAEKQPKK